MLKGYHVADNDVAAATLRTEPQFEEEENFGQRREKLVGYRVLRQFEIKLRDIKYIPN